jgi:hypothetical protein
METPRKAKLTTHEDGSGAYTIEVIFHKWGDRPIPQDNGTDVPNTVAIVELQDGTIKEVHPKRIRFDTPLDNQPFILR